MYTYKIKSLHRVIDGDTIELVVDLGFDILHKIRVRLSGIDTPEVRNMAEYSGTCLKSVGDEAKDFVEKIINQQILNSGDPLYISKGYNGKFGRSLGDIQFTSGDTLTQILKQERLAIDYTTDHEIKMQRMMELHEYHKDNLM